MLPPLHYCFLLLHAQGSCYFESKCKEQKEQVPEPAGVKTIQLLYLCKDGDKRREVLRKAARKGAGGKHDFKAITCYKRGEGFLPD